VTEQEVLVYVERGGLPTLAGRLFMRVLRERESATFEYDRGWLADPHGFALDPLRLPLSRGGFHTAGGEKLFAGLSDSAPDRWGRNLISREARREGRPRTLHESDYLLRVADVARQGAVRFREGEEGPFLASTGRPIPPLVRLGELLSAAERLESDDIDTEALALLLAPGSSLGGARPKASVLDADGSLSVAKFPSRADEWPVVAWERVALVLAAKAGIEVPASRLIDVDGRMTLVTRRFDRAGSERVPFLSAMALLGAADGEEHSYLELADAIRQHGARVAPNLEQLFRRMVFNVLVSNTDDHARNHGFLREAPGWVLSPAYDLNPVPVDVRPRIHALALDETSHDASLDTVLGVASYFGLAASRALEMVRDVGNAVSRWRTVARATGLGGTAIERMESAFAHADLKAALARSGRGT
jgi:serine/threonine-protein kinase HipA